MPSCSTQLRNVLKKVPGLKSLNQLRLHFRRRLVNWRSEMAQLYELKDAVLRGTLLHNLSAESQQEWKDRIRRVVEDPAL